MTQRRKSADFSLGDINLDASLFDIDMDLSSYSDELDQLYDLQDQTEAAIAEEDMKAVIATKNAKNITEKQKEQRETRDYYDASINSLGNRPGVYQMQKKVQKKMGGLGGLAKGLFTGNRDVTRTEYFDDTSERDAYDARLSQLNNQMNQQLDQINEELALLKNKDTDSEIHQFNADQHRNTLQRTERKIERLKEKREKEIANNRKKRLREAKNYLEDSIDKFDKESRNIAISRIEESEQTITETVQYIIDNILTAAYADKQKRIDEIIDQLNSGAEEREKTIKLKEAKQSEFKRILMSVVDIRRELEDTPIDEIEQS